MRKLLIAAVAAASVGVAAAPAVAAGPGIPKNCHEWNELLGIDNVRSCDDDS